MSKDETSVVDAMTEVVEETAEVEVTESPETEAPTEKVTESKETEAADPKEDEEPSEPLDYKAEADKWKQKFEKTNEVKENLRVANSKKADLIKQLNKEFNGDETPVKEESGDIQSQIVKALNDYKRQENLDGIGKIIADMTDNADEAEAIKVIYDNKINHSGYSEEKITEDLQLAQILANRGKYEQRAEQKVRKSIAEETALKGSITKVNSKVKEPSKKRRVSRADREWLKYLESTGRYKNLKKHL